MLFRHKMVLFLVTAVIFGIHSFKHGFNSQLNPDHCSLVYPDASICHETGNTIDPMESDFPESYSDEMMYSSYFGGNSMDESWLMITDHEGHLVISGFTYSDNFPVSGNAYCTEIRGWCDIFVMKWDLTEKKLLFSTLVGGSMIDRPTAIKLDSFGNIIIAGYTYSVDFPVTAQAFQKKNQGKQDVFLFKIDSSGTSLIFSTLLGGSSDDTPTALEIDNDGYINLLGTTSSPNFPIVPNSFQRFLKGESDLFFVRFDSTGSQLIYSTYLGGSGAETAEGMVQSHDGSFFISGTTYSPDLMSIHTLVPQDAALMGNAFLVQLPKNRYQPMMCFIIGGTGLDKAVNLLLCPDNKVCLVGNTYSVDFPSDEERIITEKELPAIFICSWDISHSKLEFSSVISGNSMDLVRTTLNVDEDYLLLAGLTYSDNLIKTDSSLQLKNNGSGDGFVIQWNKKTQHIDFATYWGGTDFDEIRCLHYIEPSRLWILGNTRSIDFPVSANAWRKNLQGKANCFLSCVIFSSKPSPALLSYPENEEFDIPMPVSFYWEIIEGQHYKLSLYDAGLQKIFESSWIKYIPFELPFVLDFEQRYYWMVQSTNRAGLIASSPLWAFRTEGKRIEFQSNNCFNKPSYRMDEPIYLRFCIQNLGNIDISSVVLSIKHPEYIRFEFNSEFTELSSNSNESQFLLPPVPYSSFMSCQLKALILPDLWDKKDLTITFFFSAEDFSEPSNTLTAEIKP